MMHPPSCRSDVSGESTKDEDETCTGEQERGKTPTALSPDEGVEQRPGKGPTSLELHELSFLSEPGMEKPTPWQCQSPSELLSGALPETE